MKGNYKYEYLLRAGNKTYYLLTNLEDGVCAALAVANDLKLGPVVVLEEREVSVGELIRHKRKLQDRYGAKPKITEMQNYKIFTFEVF